MTANLGLPIQHGVEMVEIFIGSCQQNKLMTVNGATSAGLVFCIDCEDLQRCVKGMFYIFRCPGVLCKSTA